MAASSVAAPTPVPSSAAATVDPIIKLAADHADELIGLFDLPACSDGSSCVKHHTENTKATAAFKKDALDAGVDLADYPEVDTAYDKLSTAALDFEAAECVSAPSGSTEFGVCALKVLNAKLRAKTLGLTLTTAAHKAGG